MAMVLSCADSRVPPELIFNVGLGDLFVIRTAGAVVDRSVLATTEYGATELNIPLLVVMGHESCGAVKAAAAAKGPSESANLEYLLRAIQAARRQTPAAEDDQDREGIKALVLANVEEVINDAMAKSPLLRRLVAAGKLDVVRARERPRHVLGPGAAATSRARPQEVMKALTIAGIAAGLMVAAMKNIPSVRRRPRNRARRARDGRPQRRRPSKRRRRWSTASRGRPRPPDLGLDRRVELDWSAQSAAARLRWNETIPE